MKKFFKKLIGPLVVLSILSGIYGYEHVQADLTDIKTNTQNVYLSDGFTTYINTSTAGGAPYLTIDGVGSERLNSKTTWYNYVLLDTTETYNLSTPFVTISDLTFNAEADATYSFQFAFVWRRSGGVDRPHFQYVIPSGASIYSYFMHPNTVTNSIQIFDDSAYVEPTASSINPSLFIIEGILTTGSTAGPLALQWTTGTAYDHTLDEGGFLKWARLN